jgi:hypothetical protein
MFNFCAVSVTLYTATFKSYNLFSPNYWGLILFVDYFYLFLWWVVKGTVDCRFQFG